MWVFSTQQTATTDYRQLVPIGEMDNQVGGKSQRQALIDAANSLPSQVHGNTGLYDTLLASVRDVRKNYDPSKVNTVIFMTDGQNDNASSLTLDKLISTLKAENSPLPIPVFTIAIGPDADAAGLHKISQATGGKGYVVKDPTTIRSVFLDAVVQRQCGPNC
jgi:secreted protein with Ig-like and vWFA domain